MRWFRAALMDSTLGFNHWELPSKFLVLKVHCVARDTYKGEQFTSLNSWYLWCQQDECRATLDHFKNTVHWPGLALFPVQICRVKSILTSKKRGVYACMQESKQKEQKSKQEKRWLKVSQTSANIWMKISSKERSNLLNEQSCNWKE